MHSHLGNGQIGLLYLTVLPDFYNTQPAIAFVPLANMGPSLTILNGSTGPQTSSIRVQHDLDTKLYCEYDSTDKSLKSLLIVAVDKTYIRYLRDKYIGYANITTLQMLMHLYAAYAKITEGDPEENDKRMRANYNVNQPMEVPIEQIDNEVDMVAAADNPYSAEQVVTAAYNLVFKTGMFADDCKLWRRQVAGDKIWQHFKTYFTMVDQELCKSKQILQGAGYHAANNVFVQTADNSNLQKERVDDIANLNTPPPLPNVQPSPH